jgi:hypothetical protein
MSIRHIVIWNLVATDEVGKADTVAALQRALEPLVEQIPELLSLTVTPNVAYVGVNSDAVLVADFASLEDLEIYAKHPLHVEAGASIKPLCASRVAIDIEI